MQPTRPDVDLVIDTLGMLCPLPIIEAQNAARVLGNGQLLEVVSDDRGVLADMPAWCKGTGHRFEGTDEDANGHWHCFVRLKK